MCLVVVLPQCVMLCYCVADKRFYRERKSFLCIDGSNIIPFEQVNDDYCDCEDGSDEPGNNTDLCNYSKKTASVCFKTVNKNKKLCVLCLIPIYFEAQYQ